MEEINEEKPTEPTEEIKLNNPLDALDSNKALSMGRNARQTLKRLAKRSDLFPPFPKPLTNNVRAQIKPENLKKYFLQCYNGSAGRVLLSCLCCKISEQDYEQWMKEDADFAREKKFMDRLIQERAQLLVFVKAGIVEQITDIKISDPVLMFVVKSILPETFGEKSEQKISISFENAPLRQSEAEWNAQKQLPPPSSA